MGVKFTPLVAAIVCLLIFVSCSKSSQEEVVLASVSSDEVIQANVVSGSAYELPLTKYGNVSIHKQASNYSESSTGVDSKTGLFIYKYVPESKFRGSDEVILKTWKVTSSPAASNCNRNGSSANMYESQVTRYVTIKLKVTD